MITVMHNGVAVQVHQELQGPTQHKVFSGYVEYPATGPLGLQDHGDLSSLPQYLGTSTLNKGCFLR